MNTRKPWITLTTILYREVGRFFRIWMQTLLPPVITMSIYFVVFGSLLGSRIQSIDGFSYIEFIVPGLVMMSVITNSFSNVASSFFNARFQRSVEELQVAPVPDWILVAGYVGGGMLRGILVGFLVLLVSLAFHSVHFHSLPIVVAFLVLTSMVFALAGFSNALIARRFDDISIVPTFILTPLTYFGGVFYSISLLPPIWRGLSRLNPILYMVNGFRFGFLGTSDIPIWIGLVTLMGLAGALVALNLVMLARGVGLRT
ncbi:MAG: ABC transporter permease [Candidatus Xenobium sp.]|nr:ABC transporter permease [Burkholderiales bacterium]